MRRLQVRRRIVIDIPTTASAVSACPRPTHGILAGVTSLHERTRPESTVRVSAMCSLEVFSRRVAVVQLFQPLL